MLRKVMICFALFWILLGCLCGFYLGLQHENFAKDMARITDTGDLTAFWNRWSGWKSRTAAHSHALCTAFVVMLVGLALPYMRLSRPIRWIMGVGLIVGVILGSVFEWLYVVPLMIVGNVVFILMVLVAFVGAVLGPAEAEESRSAAFLGSSAAQG
jgi:hypothetical protein